MAVVVSYRRVSTDKQVQQGEGLDIQLDRIKDFCAANNYNLVADFSDEGISGSADVIDRPGMLALLNYCKDNANDIAYIVVDKVDRLSRDLYQQLFIEKELLVCNNIKILYAGQETLNGDSLMIDAMRKMMGVFAEIERKLINQRLTDGMHKKADGGNKPVGRQPFGYTYAGNHKQTVVNEAEAATVRNIFDLRRKGVSLNQIATYLNAMQQRSEQRQQREQYSVVNRNRVWTNQSVRCILKNEYYLGVLRYGGKRIAGAHQAIIEEDVWKAVNAV